MKYMDMLVIAGVVLCSILILRSWWQKHCRLMDSLRRYRDEGGACATFIIKQEDIDYE